MINLFNGNAINLHISYLPYNRGADPNFWSFVENSKKGVTIHLLDKGLDTGDIIVQKEIKFDKDETLASSYKKLNLEIQNLFIKNWDLIKTKSYTPKKQSGGTYHRSKDKDRYFSLLPDGWDTKISDLKQPYIKWYFFDYVLTKILKSDIISSVFFGKNNKITKKEFVWDFLTI